MNMGSTRTSIRVWTIRDGARLPNGVSGSFSNERHCPSTDMPIRLQRCIPEWISERISNDLEIPLSKSCCLSFVPCAYGMACLRGAHGSIERKSDQRHY